VLASLALLASGCATTPGLTEPAPTPPDPAVRAVSAAAAAPTGPSIATTVKASWARSFRRVQKQLSGPAGVAVVPVGATRSADLLTVGTWKSGVAWSTSKVPVTVAAQRRSQSTTTKRRSRRAITASDNRAAEQLWAQLGTPTKAAARTQDVIRDAGDASTVVQRRRVRPGFTAFGQTRWALDDQARFAAGLSCLPDAKPVVSLMSQITRSQRWGLGHVPGTSFKGGWGPVGRGYLVRQLGIVTLSDGSKLGVAIAVSAPHGFTRGTRDLTTIGRWLARRVNSLDGGSCPKG
jgi:hypothetical protein